MSLRRGQPYLGHASSSPIGVRLSGVHASLVKSENTKSLLTQVLLQQVFGKFGVHNLRWAQAQPFANSASADLTLQKVPTRSELKELKQRFRELLEQMGGMLQHFKSDTLAAFKASGKSVRFTNLAERSYPGAGYSPTASPSSRGNRGAASSPRTHPATGSPRRFQAGQFTRLKKTATPELPDDAVMSTTITTARHGLGTRTPSGRPLQATYKPVTPIDNAGVSSLTSKPYPIRAAGASALGSVTTHSGPSSPPEKKILQSAIRRVAAFASLSSQVTEKIIQMMYRRDLKDGETLVSQGEPLDHWYVVGGGSLMCMTKPAGGFTAQMTTRYAGESVGDECLSQLDRDVASQMSVQASGGTWVWVLDKATYRESQGSTGIRSTVIQRRTSFSIKQRAIHDFLKSVKALQSLTDVQFSDMARGAKQQSYKKGEPIVTQGGNVGPFYIIKDGRAVVRRTPEAQAARGGMKGGQIMGKYKRHDYFGERSSLYNAKRAATVQAVTDLMCVVVEAAVFRRIVSENSQFKDLLYKRIATYKEPQSAKDVPFRNRVTTQLRDLEDLGVLGVGSFGRVHLMKDPKSEKTPAPTYALKVVRKKRVVETGQQEHMKNERKILSKLDCPFIVRLEATYQDKTKVYFLMEAVLGGELFTVLRYNRKFSERTARFYAGCCVLAFEHMHQKDIIYRDLKPENLLLDNKGYVKLTDFGFAKVRNNTCTLCGTPEYLAPEVIRNWTQSYAVDWWGLGILIFEMLVSNPPFEDDESMKMYEKILTCPVSHGKHVSRPARSLIDGLLKKNAYQRLGSGSNGAEDIKKHAWFEDFDWNKLMRCDMRTPYVPRVRNNEDLSNFEEYPPEKDTQDYIKDPNSDQYAWAKDF